MELLLETVGGFEEQAVKEIEELAKTSKNTKKVEEGYIKLIADKSDVFRLNYGSGTLNRVIAITDSFQIKKPEDCYESMEIAPEEFLDKEQTFAIRVVRKGKHGFSSVDAAREAGQRIVDSFEEETGKRLEVDLDNPDITFRLYLFRDQAFFGIDTTGRALNRRNYLKQEPDIPPILANCLVRYSDWEPGEKLLDPFTRNGIVAIEAGRIEARAPNTQRKFGFLDSRYFSNQKYAEIAGKMNKRMEEQKTKITGIDKKVEDARDNAERANVKIDFEELTAMEKNPDGYHVVFDTPYLPEKSKRKQIENYVKRFEEKLLSKNPESVTCTTRSESFFEKMKKKTEVEWDGFKASVFSKQ